MLVAVGLCIGLSTLWSIEKQVETAVEQTEAAWYSMRPILDIEAISPKKDILPWPSVSDTTPILITDSSMFHRLHLEFKNVGKSPALLDSVHYKWFSNDTGAITAYEVSLMIVPGGSEIVPVVTLLKSGGDNYLKVYCDYYWEQRKTISKPLHFNRNYRFFYEDSTWRSRVIGTNELELLTSGVEWFDRQIVD